MGGTIVLRSQSSTGHQGCQSLQNAENLIEAILTRNQQRKQLRKIILSGLLLAELDKHKHIPVRDHAIDRSMGMRMSHHIGQRLRNRC